MFGCLYDTKNYDFSLQCNYDKFFELCNEKEKKFMDRMIEKYDKNKLEKMI